MSKTVWQIKHAVKIPGKDSGWETETTLTRYSDLQINLSTGDGKDRFNLVMPLDNSPTISTNDKLTISRRFDDDAHTDDDILIAGIVRTSDPSFDATRRVITIAGYNFSEAVTTALVFVDATNLTIPQLFQEAINATNLYNSEFNVTWNTNNPSLKKDKVTSFPIVGERVFYKSFREVIEKFSSAQYTQDGNYYWFVDKNNTLVWKPVTDSTFGTFNDSTSVFNSFKVVVDVDDVKNYVVVKGGLDHKGRVLTERATDYTSISKHGFKYYIMANEAKTTESYKEVDKLAAGVDDMQDASYPFTPEWSGGSSYSSFDDYADAFNVYIRSILRERGNDFIALHRYGKFKTTVGLKPVLNTYKIGNLITFTINTNSIGVKQMRLVDINYTSTNDSLSFEEDIGTN